MSISEIIREEKIFNSAQNIKYLFLGAKSKSEHLIVVFSAFNPKGSPPAYNYIRTLQHLDVNKLFILDDQGERGSYYLGQDRRFDVEASVVSLITNIANQNNILHNNIICCGSSKGGYASLYYSIKYGFGHAIVGAPQTYLGNYLLHAEEYPTLKFIAGETNPESVGFLNNLLFDLVPSAKKIPNLTMHVGSGDHHYQGHVLPFIEHLKKYGFDAELDVKDYNDHGEVKYFQKLLLEKLILIVPSLKNSIKINSIIIEKTDSIIKLKVEVNRKSQIAWYIYKNGERIEHHWYSDNHSLTYNPLEKGLYKFIVFAKDEDGNIYSEESEEIKFEIGN